MEQRQELKDNVKQRLIEIMAEQIAQNEDFGKLKNELIAELLYLEPKKPEKRAMNSNDGYDPINEQEEKYKKEFGFIFNPDSVEERFKIIRKETKNTKAPGEFSPATSLSDFFNRPDKSVVTHAIYEPYFTNSASNKFREKFPIMKEIINAEPNPAIRNAMSSFRDKLVKETHKDFDYAEVIKDLSDKKELSEIEKMFPPTNIHPTNVEALAKPSIEDTKRVNTQIKTRIKKNTADNKKKAVSTKKTTVKKETKVKKVTAASKPKNKK